MKKVVCVCDICKKEIDPESERFTVAFGRYTSWLASDSYESSEPKDLCLECYDALMDIMFPRQSLPKVETVVNRKIPAPVLPATTLSNESKESKDPKGPEYITIVEAAQIFGLSKSRTYNILKSAGVPGTMLGKRMLYLKHQVVLCKECYDENKCNMNKRDMDKRNMVKDLYLKGWSYAQIAKKLGVARSSVGYYVKELKDTGDTAVLEKSKAFNSDINYSKPVKKMHTTVDEYGLVTKIEYE